jgi:hypothetical protein
MTTEAEWEQNWRDFQEAYKLALVGPALEKYMQTSHFYNLLAKIVVKTGYDFENDQELTGTERESIRQGLRDIEFFSPTFAGRAEVEVRSTDQPQRTPQRVKK